MRMSTRRADLPIQNRTFHPSSLAIWSSVFGSRFIEASVLTGQVTQIDGFGMAQPCNAGCRWNTKARFATTCSARPCAPPQATQTSLNLSNPEFSNRLRACLPALPDLIHRHAPTADPRFPACCCRDGAVRRVCRVVRLGRRRNHPALEDQKPRPESSPNFTPCHSATCPIKAFCPVGAQAELRIVVPRCFRWVTMRLAAPSCSGLLDRILPHPSPLPAGEGWGEGERPVNHGRERPHQPTENSEEPKTFRPSPASSRKA